jgi:hypothetical protein
VISVLPGSAFQTRCLEAFVFFALATGSMYFPEPWKPENSAPLSLQQRQFFTFMHHRCINTYTRGWGVHIYTDRRFRVDSRHHHTEVVSATLAIRAC